MKAASQMTEMEALDRPSLRCSESEMIYLGCLLGTQKLALSVSMCDREWFFSPANRTIFDAICAQAAIGADCTDLALLVGALMAEGRLEQVGGADYVAQLAEESFKASSIKLHAMAIRDAWARRTAISRAYSIADRAIQGPVDSMLEEASRIMHGLEDSTTDLWDAAEIDMSSNRDMAGCASPFASVNQSTSCEGWPCSQVTLVEALKKTGKTSVMLQAAVHAAQQSDRVLFATFEMSKEQLIRRIYRMLTGFSTRPRDMFLAEQWDADIRKMSAWDLSIYDPTGSDGAFSVERFYQRVLEASAAAPYHLVIVDFAQKLSSSGRFQNRTAELEHVSNMLARLARRMPKTAFLVGSQVTMVDGEARAKGCQQLEEDCGLCLLLKRDKQNQMSAQITYNRFGPSWVDMPIVWNDKRLTIEEGYA